MQEDTIPINIESIIKQFEFIEGSLRRAKLPFETNMLHGKIIDVSLWELMKSYKQIENMIREIDPKRFGKKVIEKREYHIPVIDHHDLDVCPICGDPDCGSDHK